MNPENLKQNRRDYHQKHIEEIHKKQAEWYQQNRKRLAQERKNKPKVIHPRRALQQEVVEYSLQHSRKEALAQYKDRIHINTLYRWLANAFEYTYPKEAQLREFERIQQQSKPYDKAFPNYNKIVLSYQPHFYEKERKFLAVKNNYNKVLQNRQHYLNKTDITSKELLRGCKIAGYLTGYSHFSPFWIKYFIEQYNIQSIYDPTGGWGHRLLGAHNIKYIYNDIWSKSCNGVKKIISDFALSDKTVYNQDCTQFTPEEEYECIFTCPPYYNTEIYNNGSFESVEAYSQFLQDMFRCAIKPSVRIIAIVISSEWESVLINACPFALHKTEVMGKHQHHFNRSNQTTTIEKLYIFTR